MAKVLIEVRNGTVFNVTATDDVRVCVVDWDNLAVGGSIDSSFTDPNDVATEAEIDATLAGFVGGPEPAE